jgi:hypothetical protein
MLLALAVLACSPPVAGREQPGAPPAADATLEAGAIDAPRAAAPTSLDLVPALGSWYGPGMWGNRTACGAVLTDDLLGVAHRTLPCGTPVTLRYGGVTVTVPVVDRGPYVAAREFDLTYATRAALGCPDLCRLAWLR